MASSNVSSALPASSQTARCKRYRLILAEQDRLRLGRAKIGARRFGLAGAVQMLGAQHRIIGKDRGRGSVQFPLPRVRERAVDAVAHQRMSELQTVPGRTHQDVPHQRVAIVLRLLEQRPEVGKAEALAEDRGCLNRATILGRQQIGTGQHDALNGCREASVREVAGASEQLLQEQRIAAGTLDALIGERRRIDEAPRDRPRVGRRKRRKIDGDQRSAAGDAAPMRIEGIALDAGGHDENRSADRGGAGDRREQAERFRIGPMHVLDRDQKRPVLRRGFYQGGDDALLAVSAASASIAS